MDEAWQDDLDLLDARLAALPSEDTLLESVLAARNLGWWPVAAMP